MCGMCLGLGLCPGSREGRQGDRYIVPSRARNGLMKGFHDSGSDRIS